MCVQCVMCACPPGRLNNIHFVCIGTTLAAVHDTRTDELVQMRADQKASPSAAIMAAPAAPISSRATGELAELKAQLLEEQRKHKQAKDALLTEQQYFASEIAHLEELTKRAQPSHSVYKEHPLFNSACQVLCFRSQGHVRSHSTL
jgi:hypothetical protein